MKMKYIISSVNGRHSVIIFTENLVHKEMARGIRSSALWEAPRNWEHRNESAGFFRVVDGAVQTYGESETLELKPRAGDGLLIAQALGLVTP